MSTSISSFFFVPFSRASMVVKHCSCCSFLLQSEPRSPSALKPTGSTLAMCWPIQIQKSSREFTGQFSSAVFTEIHLDASSECFISTRMRSKSVLLPMPRMP